MKKWGLDLHTSNTFFPSDRLDRGEFGITHPESGRIDIARDAFDPNKVYTTQDETSSERSQSASQVSGSLSQSNPNSSSHSTQNDIDDSDSDSWPHDDSLDSSHFDPVIASESSAIEPLTRALDSRLNELSGALVAAHEASHRLYFQTYPKIVMDGFKYRELTSPQQRAVAHAQNVQGDIAEILAHHSEVLNLNSYLDRHEIRLEHDQNHDLVDGIKSMRDSAMMERNRFFYSLLDRKDGSVYAALLQKGKIWEALVHSQRAVPDSFKPDAEWRDRIQEIISPASIVRARLGSQYIIQNVEGSDMNCLIRALYRAANVESDDAAIASVRADLVRSGAASSDEMLDLTTEQGAVLVQHLIQRGVLTADTGITVHTDADAQPIIDGQNTIHLWFSDSHFQAIVHNEDATSSRPST